MRMTLITLAAVLVGLLLPGSASAATCADYDNQAQAQRAADTRDADADGIYCQALPCPCLKPGAGSTPPAPPPPPPPAQEATSCGVERRAVKTLTDEGASRVSFVAKPTTIAAMRLLPAPDVRRNSPRLPGEFSTYRVKVRLRSMKIEDDSDIHLVIADPTSATRTMIAEFPNAGCVRDAGATSRRKMAAARVALLRSCGRYTQMLWMGLRKRAAYLPG